MANTLIQQTALSIVFNGKPETIDYSSLVDALTEEPDEVLDEVLEKLGADAYLSEHFDCQYELGGLDIPALLNELVSTLTKFSGDVVASV